MSFFRKKQKQETMDAPSVSSGIDESLSADDLNKLGADLLSSDPVKAYEYFMKAADKGSAKAMGNIATCYWTAKGVPFSAEKAVQWHTKAAENGNLNSLRTLSIFYLAGIAVPQSEAQCIQMLKEAADKGDEKAANYLIDFDDIKDSLVERLRQVVAARQ